MDRQGTLTANFTGATTDIITSNAHGLKNGDMVVLTTTTALPAGLATATVYWVIEATTNTFKLSATSLPNYTTGVGQKPDAVDITGTGTGTHTFTMHDIGRNIFVDDFRHCILSLDGDSNANMTVKFQGSTGKSVDDPDDAPDFSAAQARDNSWDYIEVYDLESGSAIDGDTGVAQAGTNDHRMFEVNINGISWLNAIITAYSAGNTTITIKLYND